MDETKKAAQLSDMWRGTACADLSDCIAALPADLGEIVSAIVQQAAGETEDRLTSMLWCWGAIRLCERLSEIIEDSAK